MSSRSPSGATESSLCQRPSFHEPWPWCVVRITDYRHRLRCPGYSLMNAGVTPLLRLLETLEADTASAAFVTKTYGRRIG